MVADLRIEVYRGDWAESNGYRALVTDGLDFVRNACRLYVLRPFTDGQVEVMDPITGLRAVKARPELASPELVPIHLPIDAMAAVRDAAAFFVGGPRDDFRARYEATREALEHERGRVDRLLGLAAPLSVMPPRGPA